MAVRIHFTGIDLARTRIAGTMGPFAETMWAMSMLRCPLPLPASLSSWRDLVRSRRTSGMGDLEALIPPGDLGVDLYSRTGESATIETGIAGLLALPRELMLAEMDDVARRRRLPASAWAVTEMGSDARQRLADAILACYNTLVEPYWPGIHAHLRTEQAARGRVMVDGGVDRLLSTLQPSQVRWRPPVLEVDGPGPSLGRESWGWTDVDLGGHGLTLVPSLFIGTGPVVMFDQPASGGQRVRLVFPASPGPSARVHLWDGRRPAGKAVCALIGRTRALVLACVGDGCTTTELASRVGVSAAAASQHASVLRDAGLIITRRNGIRVLHTLTPLGAELLTETASPAAEPRSLLPAGTPVTASTQVAWVTRQGSGECLIGWRGSDRHLRPEVAEGQRVRRHEHVDDAG